MSVGRRGGGRRVKEKDRFAAIRIILMSDAHGRLGYKYVASKTNTNFGS